MESSSNDVVQISSVKFLAGCAVTATLALLAGFVKPLPPSLIAVEVLFTVLALFVFGSIKYRIDKNALTFGAGLVIVATFWPLWKATWAANAGAESASWATHVVRAAHHYLLTLHGLDQLVHADTMLFILGLTFFVADWCPPWPR